MQPEVLAWALLFVIAFALVYRFFAWLGRTLKARTSSLEPQPASRSPIAESAVSAPITSNEAPTVIMPPPAPPKLVEPPANIPPPATGNVPKPAPARDYATAAPAPLAETVARREVIPAPPSSPAPVYSAPTNPGPSSAVISARLAGEAVRTAAAPSVAATLPPPTPLKPSVEATLPLVSAISQSALKAVETAGPASAPAELPSAAPAVEAEPDETETTSAAEVSAFDEALPPKIVRLRARRIGAEAVSLDLRLRDSRERKIRRAPEISRKTAKPADSRVLRVLGRKASRAKLPERRIGQKEGRALTLISISKTATKIIGTPRRPSRVLSAASV